MHHLHQFPPASNKTCLFSALAFCIQTAMAFSASSSGWYNAIAAGFSCACNAVQTRESASTIANGFVFNF